ncbi:MAG TPA: formyltransferase family protein [Solirubrobacteraceae bacterium]|nr:formyltransferase family protein [Solirubrobacteraceae bacterium]
MRVLFLGPAESSTLAHLAESGEEVTSTADPLDPAAIERDRPDFVVSHRYRHIIKPDVLALVPNRAINLHISYLPWNRGADPNLWSWAENTRKGVTIHYIDAGVDTGDIIAQREVEFEHGETLSSSYARLEEQMLRLFVEQWPRIRTGDCDRRPQQGEGSMHRVADRQRIEHLLVAGWDTPVAALAPS